MGAKIFDFLTESFLFDISFYGDRFGGINDDEIFDELQRYRQFCLSSLDALTEDAIGSPSPTRVFAGMNSVGLETLKQSALYIHQYILPDPLFPLTESRSGNSDAVASYLGYQKSRLNRDALIEALKRLKCLTPMVAADYVKFLPVSKLFEAPEHTPIYYSPNQFSDVLPTDVLEFLQGKAIVRSLRKNPDSDGWIVEETLTRGRGIAINFEGDDCRHTRVQHYFDVEVLSVDDDGNFKFLSYLPLEPPSPEMFKAWVTQSVNRAAGDYFDRVQTEFGMSKALGTSFLTNSELVNELLTRFFNVSDRTATHTANVLLNVQVPFLDNIDVEDLMRIRTQDGEVFENFRNELNTRMWDLRFEADPVRLRDKAQKIVHDLGAVQTHALKMKAQDLKKGALAEAVILSATLVGSVIANAALVAPVIALAGAAKIMANYRSGLRSNPAFFLWKSMRH